MEVVQSPYLNTLSMLVTNSKAKEEIFRSDFLLSDLQDFREGYKNAMNKEDYLKNYATEERKKPSIIYQIEAAIVSVLNWDALRYGGGAGGGRKRHKHHSERELKHLSSF